MVPLFNPVILLTKLPEVAFSAVIPSLLSIVGLETVSHTTPDAVIAAPPLVSIVPPLTAELSVIEVTEAVVIVGRSAIKKHYNLMTILQNYPSKNIYHLVTKPNMNHFPWLEHN